MKLAYHNKSAWPDEIKITSERLLPLAQYLVGRWFAQCEYAKKNGDEEDVWDACSTFWWGINSLFHLATCMEEAVYFNIASTNERSKAAVYIEECTGHNPLKEKGMFGFD